MIKQIKNKSMRTKVSDTIIYTLIILFAINTAYGQEKNAAPGKLDFLVTPQQSDLITEEKTPVFNLKLDILYPEIRDPQKVYVKIISEKPREIYFIRAIDKEVLAGLQAVDKWEKEQIEKEEAREALRTEKNQTREEDDKLWEGPRYEKQDGRSLQAIEIKDRKPALVFGPFPPGDYQVYVRVVDEKGTEYLDRHNITISKEAEPTEEDTQKDIDFSDTNN